MAAHVLSRVENIIYLTGLINLAANNTMNSIAQLGVNARRNQTHILKSSWDLESQQGITRRQAGTPTDTYRIVYNPADITLIGGSVLTIYDHLLPASKAQHDIKPLQSYMQRRTTDIDMVWWPTIKLNEESALMKTKSDKERKEMCKKFVYEKEPYIVISTSPAIMTVADVFEEQLRTVFQEAIPTIQTNVLIALLENAVPIQVQTFSIDVSRKSQTITGTHTMIVSITVNGIIMEEICQISLHDGGSSQLYRRDGERITQLEHMMRDPVYCTIKNAYLIKLKEMNINVPHVHTIQIPSVLDFAEQQMFAFGNNMLPILAELGTVQQAPHILHAKQYERYAKAFAHFKRAFYLKLVMHAFNLSEPVHNKKTIVYDNTFLTRHLSHPALLHDLEEVIWYRMRTFAPHIRMAMEVIGQQHDPLLHFLFDPILTEDEWAQTIFHAKKKILGYKKQYMQSCKDPQLVELLKQFTSINEALVKLTADDYKKYYHAIMLSVHVNELIFKMRVQCNALKHQVVHEGLYVTENPNTTTTIMHNYMTINTIYDDWNRNTAALHQLHTENMKAPLHIINVLFILLEEFEKYTAVYHNRSNLLGSIARNTHRIHHEL